MSATKTNKALAYNGLIRIAIGKSRRETAWRTKEMQWSDLVDKLSRTTRTRETSKQFKDMTKNEQRDIKDVGGFVGGVLTGRRKRGCVSWRTLLTLDADFVDKDIKFWDTLRGKNAIVLYSTHSHTSNKPKLRLVAPFARPVSSDEYEALSRFIAADIGIDIFDDTTYQSERLMYWPSTPDDGEYIFDSVDGPWIDPDDILKKHPDWQDISTWPESSRANKIRQRFADKQGDPRVKPGVVGAFCRAYTVTEAIDAFLSDVYEPCDVSGRYTYVKGSTSAGVVIYDDDQFLYSHHGTDPVGGVLVNAFDAVRCHKFSLKDEDVDPHTPVNRLPSYKAMVQWALDNARVRIKLSEINTATIAEDFGDPPEDTPGDTPGEEWKAKLKFNEKGIIVNSINNALLILRNDIRLKGTIALEEFTRSIMVKKSTPWRDINTPDPWTDSDDAALRHYLEVAYNITKREAINDALQIVQSENAYHPVRDYLDNLNWDGKERVSQVLIKYMGAEDNIYTQQVFRKWLIAAVARIRHPGIKFDYMLILIGPQGAGKSMFFAKLARQAKWFSDSLNKFDNSKDSMEQLAGKWILELGELSAMKKYEVEHVKVFLSKQEDSYRPSYGRRVESYPRQCVFAGTTNREDFLQDATGGRRFWPVKIGDTTKFWQSLNPETIDQLWAEADFLYSLGEDLYISGEAETLAKELQEQYTELGGKVGAAEEFLNILIPTDWDGLKIQDRLDFLNHNSLDDSLVGNTVRTYISGVELFVECFGGRIDKYQKRDAYEMSDILTVLGWQKQKSAKRLPDYGRQRQFKRSKIRRIISDETNYP